MKHMEIDLQQHPECEHMGLVIQIARAVWQKVHRQIPSLEEEDLISGGWHGLRRAYLHYDSNKGGFARYAGFAIRQHIWDVVHQAHHLLYIPVNLKRLVVAGKLDRARECGYGDYQAASVAMNLHRHTFAGHHEQAEVDRNMAALEARDHVETALSFLSALDRKIITLRHLTVPHKTLQEVGQEVGLSREWVRRREEASLEYIRRVFPI